jgi:protoporphyrinogen oxidase
VKTAVIIGAGPAGLTAAFELLTRTDIKPIIIEADKQVGGISKTIDYKGNKIDIGGHRFFSKSQKVLDWWLQFLPLDPLFNNGEVRIQYQNQTADLSTHSNLPLDPDKVMLVRKRKSRIFYNNTLFDYPLSLSGATVSKLGIWKTVRAGVSYLRAKALPRKPETTLEDFFINRFGFELYDTFFKDYTAKVWGVPCNKIPASWGQQRVKNLDVAKLLTHAVRSVFVSNKRLDQKGTSTSLIEQFLYPKYGPGQMWETVAEEIIKLGGEIKLNTAVTQLTGDNKDAIAAVEITNLQNDQKNFLRADYFFSTMPVKELIGVTKSLPVPAAVQEIAGQLEYRDFLIVGLLTDKLLFTEKDGSPITDNWIYLQDKNVTAGRLQLFHNWSPFMIAQPGHKWLGVEYFCNEQDAFWNLPDGHVAATAVSEIVSMGLIDARDVKDTLVVRIKKAYPSYYGAYKDFGQVEAYLNTIHNLFPIGRNGMHRYNNSDHSMLTAMASVDNIINGITDKTNIWQINTGDEYHEDKTAD